MKLRTYLAAGALVGASLSYFEQLAREAYDKGYKAGRLAGAVQVTLAGMEPDAGPPAVAPDVLRQRVAGIRRDLEQEAFEAGSCALRHRTRGDLVEAAADDAYQASALKWHRRLGDALTVPEVSRG